MIAAGYMIMKSTPKNYPSLPVSNHRTRKEASEINNRQLTKGKLHGQETYKKKTAHTIRNLKCKLNNDIPLTLE